MRTTRPFSTISWNSEFHLIKQLDEMIRQRSISFYAVIKHHAEEDEKKDHYHVYVEPDGQMDTHQFMDRLEEIDPKNPLKPIRIARVQNSKFADWYLYGKHDSAYLASKGQSRQYHYEDDDFIVSDSDVFLDLKHHIDWSKINATGHVIQAAEQGMTFAEYIKENPVNMLAVRSVQFIFEQVQGNMRNEVNRNGRRTHSPVDEETGEIIE